ncbi:MAG: B12-binding domain-containing radical SAM protein [Phycisphaerae bacterium]|nr:B12-binding domain-containing radical SAM protein [Phycisphaerae bacterium]
MKRLRLFLANVGRRTLTYPFTTPPMGILSLAAYLRTKFDLDITLINQRVEDCSEQELARQIVDFGADVVGFGTMTTNAHMLGELTKMVRRGLPDALIVLGGPHVSAFREGVMSSTVADAAVVGEGELALEELIRARFGDGDFSAIPGLIWRSHEGEIVTNPGCLPPIQDLDSLPFPAYDLIDIRKYWRLQSMPPIARRRYVSVVGSRGCPYQCMWCHNIFGKRFRPHSAERLVDEVEHYIHTWGVKDVEFLDDIFNLDRKRVIEFCELAQRRNLKFKIALPNAVRSDILDEEVVEALVDTGLYFSAFALESGSSRLQQYTGKRLDIPRFLKGIEMAVDRGVFSHGFAMLGFPTETEADLQQTIETACDSKLHIASFFTVMPFPNTRLYDEVMRTHPERLAKLRYDDTNFALIRVNLSEVSDEVLYAYQRKANRAFFLDPARILRILRDYPQPHLLPYYLPIYLYRATKGLFGGDGHC